mmetsp:Transcript_54974/g.102980  ORF Transcript_54974/g.102980 Transcript_54974/m.102980 type:complete len:255 (-) Transcript_54974:437-1201(-)
MWGWAYRGWLQASGQVPGGKSVDPGGHPGFPVHIQSGQAGMRYDELRSRLYPLPSGAAGGEPLVIGPPLACASISPGAMAERHLLDPRRRRQIPGCRVWTNLVRVWQCAAAAWWISCELASWTWPSPASSSVRAAEEGGAHERIDDRYSGIFRAAALAEIFPRSEELSLEIRRDIPIVFRTFRAFAGWECSDRTRGIHQCLAGLRRVPPGCVLLHSGARRFAAAPCSFPTMLFREGIRVRLLLLLVMCATTSSA